MIIITRITENGLRRDEWDFSGNKTFMNPELRLQQYAHYERPSRRHGWNVVRAYTSYARRRESNLALADVPKPEDVKQEALDRYIASIDFKWE